MGNVILFNCSQCKNLSRTLRHARQRDGRDSLELDHSDLNCESKFDFGKVT